MATIELDVRDLKHPEPFERVIKAYSTLKDGDTIHMIHRKKPLPLFDFLKNQPLTTFSFEEDNNGIWHIFINKLSKSE